MITAHLLEQTGSVIAQRLNGVLSVADVRRGIKSALPVIQNVVSHVGKVDLILELFDCTFAELQAHRIWREEFCNGEIVTRNARRVAIVGNDTPGFRAEKNALETPECRFFISPQEARDWLLDRDKLLAQL